MSELRSLLSFMDAEDRDRAIRRYEAMFDAAGAQGEEALLTALGSPVRQVVAVERELREAQKKGETPFAPGPVTLPEMKQETAPSDLARMLRAAAAALEDGSEAAVEEGPQAEPLYDDDFPIGDYDFAPPSEPEPLPPETPEEPEIHEDVSELSEAYEDASDAQYPAEEIGEDLEIAPVQAEEAEAELADLPGPSDREELPMAPESDTPEEPEALEEPEPMAEVTESETLPEPKEEPEEEPAAKPKKAGKKEKPDSPGAGRVFAAVVATAPLLVLWVVSFTLFISLGILVVALGLGVCMAGVYVAGYVFNGAITFVPDLLLAGGGALLLLALAILLMWTGLWVGAGGCMLVIHLTRGMYGRILGRPQTEEVEDDG